MKSILLRMWAKFAHMNYETLAKMCPSRGTIFMLHDISNKKDSEFCISSEQLESLLKKFHKSNIISLSGWESANNFIAFTIDDVPEGFYHYGFPLFKKYQVPFTIFVNTSLLNTAGFITTAQLKEMAAFHLCTVGSHGSKHDYYRRMNQKQKLEFLEESKRELSNLVGPPIDLFAFPYGSFFACGFKSKRLVEKYYKYGFGTIQIPITKPLVLKKYFLPRININQKWIETNL